MKSKPLQEISTEYEKAGMLPPEALGRMLTQAGYYPEESKQMTGEKSQEPELPKKGLSRLVLAADWKNRKPKK